MKIVFFGTPHFSAALLDELLKRGVEVAAVISKPDRPKGRSLNLSPTPVKELILEKYPSIPLYQPVKVSAPEFAPTLEALKADVFVVVAYGEILREHLLNMPKIACINVHTSLLPKYRGAAPIHRAVMEGESESGVTLMHLSKKMDEGDIIRQTKVAIGPDMTYGELQEKLIEVARGDLYATLGDLERGTAERIPQDHEKATLAPKVELEECEVLWDRPAEALHNLIRGTNPEPGAWCWVKVKDKKLRLKIFRSHLVTNEDSSAQPGTLVGWGKEGWKVACKPGVLELLEVQLEGKKRMSAAELMRGIPRESLLLF